MIKLNMGGVGTGGIPKSLILLYPVAFDPPGA